MALQLPLVSVEDVHKAYRRGGSIAPVLKGVSFDVRPGECVFLVGPSGSGKSTLLCILGTLLTPDRGRVMLFGQETGRLSPSACSQLRRERIGFVFQRFRLLRGLSALENVQLPLILSGVSERVARRRATDLLAQVGLATEAQMNPQQMSVGQCQRVSVARAFAGDPQLLLADEPTASLDSVQGSRVMTLFQGLVKREALTAVVVTHDPRIFHHADRILNLDDGQIRHVPVRRSEVNSADHELDSAVAEVLQ